MLDPSSPKDFIYSFLLCMDKARLPQMGIRGGKGGDGNHNDIELISLGVITCFLNAEIFP